MNIRALAVPFLAFAASPAYSYVATFMQELGAGH